MVDGEGKPPDRHDDTATGTTQCPRWPFGLKARAVQPGRIRHLINDQRRVPWRRSTRDSASQLPWNYDTTGTPVSGHRTGGTLILTPMIDCLPPCNSAESISQRPRIRSSAIAGRQSADPGDPYLCAADGRPATLQFPRNSGPRTPELTSSEMQPHDNTAAGRYRT